MNKIASLYLLALAVLVLPAQLARAELSIDITQGVVDPIPVAVTRLLGGGETEQVGRDVATVVAADLERSGLFRAIDTRAFIQQPEAIALQPSFGDWRQINSQLLVTGNVGIEADGRLQATFRLWDTFAESQMTGFTFRTVPSNWRRVAHKIADAIYKRVTGEDGYFDTRVVYVSETGAATRRVKRLAMMDQDGANHRFLTNGDDLVLTPRFSPTAQEITFMSYFNDTPRVYIHNIDTGQQELLGNFPGMTFAPRFSPDGNRVVMSLSVGGNSEIFVMDLRTRRIDQLTKDPAIDTSPSFAPDSSRIAFNSDRGGSPQLYVMSASGANPQRISFGDGRYSTPVWSPRGDLIAFTKQHKGLFYIGVMRPDGSGERLLTKSYLDEGPTWSPNGRVIMFFRETPTSKGNVSKLFSVDLTGYNERLVVTPLDGSDPAWSPSLP
ncbi:MAG: Tol-Pal system protein TolB [Alphaproteobacteria bacterium]|nr:Tol-Pal system protein TolB [Alphaproteobacteria bacterium]